VLECATLHTFRCERKQNDLRNVCESEHFLTFRFPDSVRSGNEARLFGASLVVGIVSLIQVLASGQAFARVP